MYSNSQGQFFTGAKLFIRIPKYSHSWELHDWWVATKPYIFLYSKWVYFYDNILSLRRPHLTSWHTWGNALGMQKRSNYHLPFPSPKVYSFYMTFPLFISLHNIYLWVCNCDKLQILPLDEWTCQTVSLMTLQCVSMIISACIQLIYVFNDFP